MLITDLKFQYLDELEDYIINNEIEIIECMYEELRDQVVFNYLSDLINGLHNSYSENISVNIVVNLNKIESYFLDYLNFINDIISFQDCILKSVGNCFKDLNEEYISSIYMSVIDVFCIEDVYGCSVSIDLDCYRSSLDYKYIRRNDCYSKVNRIQFSTPIICIFILFCDSIIYYFLQDCLSIKKLILTILLFSIIIFGVLGFINNLIQAGIEDEYNLP